MKKLTPPLLLLLTSLWSYNIPIGTHVCYQVVLNDGVTKEGEKFYLKTITQEGVKKIKIKSDEHTETINKFLEESVGFYLIIYCEAPLYYGYATEDSHEIIDIDKNPIRKID